MGDERGIQERAGHPEHVWITPWHLAWNLSLSRHTQHGMDTALTDQAGKPEWALCPDHFKRTPH